MFAADYAAVPGKLELTVLLTRIMFPFLVLVALAVAFMGMLNSLGHFFVPALSPALFNVGAIVGAIVLVPLMKYLGWHPVAGLAFGTLVGGLLQAAVQWPTLRREGFRFSPAFDLRDPALREILILMGPGTIGLAAVQINQFVNTVLATGEGTGAVSWLNYAFRLMYLPIGLFGVSIATAAVPAIATLAANDDKAGMRRTISSGLRLMLMLNVPATIGLIALAGPIVSLIFERGSFGPAGYAGDGGGADVLCSRSARLFGREDRVTDLLRAPRQPHAGHRQRRSRCSSMSCSTWRWCACSAIAVWRWARRWRP